jgi:structural maintenance of chromosome 4
MTHFQFSRYVKLIPHFNSQTELEQEVEKAKRKLAENEKSLASVVSRLERLELQEIDEDDDDEEVENEEDRQPKQADELKNFTEEELEEFDAEALKGQIALLEGEL